MKIIEVTEMEESSETAQDLVGRVVPALVEHYRQISCRSEEPPYLPRQRTSRNSVVIQHWVTRLEDSIPTRISWRPVGGLPNQIRPALFQSNKDNRVGVAVLIHYEFCYRNSRWKRATT
jgi:hypothetical protein